MGPRSLQAVLRSLADAVPPASDAELVRRFLAGEADAFAALVGRHGRLVWAACRHLTGSDADADDAFQATFLVLLRNARKIRENGRLSAWLYGVAYKVSARARRSAARRAARESVAARRDGAEPAVADSAWDRALAAVHEEAGALPESLRVPFVLCCLEGLGPTEAADRLGWKLGTLSSRLARAKDAVVARLQARGLGLGAVAGLALAVPPASAVAAATSLARGGNVPASVLQLSKGVMGMGLTSFKLVAAGVLVACGLGLGAGGVWQRTADAQRPSKPLPKVGDDVQQLRAELERLRYAEEAARRAAEEQVTRAREALEQAAQKAQGVKTPRWEYDFVQVSEMTQAKFTEFLRDRDGRGWEFTGTTPLTVGGQPTPAWLFRRPGGAAAASPRTDTTDLFKKLGYRDDYNRKAAAEAGAKADEVKVLEAEIARLQERLAALKAAPARGKVVFAKDELPVPPAELAALIGKLADRKFGKGRCDATATDSSVTVVGDKEVIDWAASLVKRLADK